MSEVLSKDYVLELLKAALYSDKVMGICAEHLKYEFLQGEAQKKIFKYMVDTFNVTGTSPTLGSIGLAYPSNVEVIALLGKMKKIQVDTKTDVILASFEGWLKDMSFQAVLAKSVELYNGGKVAEAQKHLSKEAQRIENFTLKEKYYTKVFTDFEERNTRRFASHQHEEVEKMREKMTTGIHEFDALVKGGFKRGTSFLAMAASGKGKSTYLRWVAICNARLGKRVVFFQGEDTEDAAMEAFDSAWTAITGDDIEIGIPEEELEHIRKIRREIKSRGGEIILIADEEFKVMSIEEGEEKLNDIIKVEGPVDMALFDYLEIFTTKGHQGKSADAERRRREDVSNKMTKMATSHKIVVGTATQSMDIAPEVQNNPDFKLTRHNASEFKGVVKPFSYFFTFNATEDEYKQQILRIYMDKFRKHPSGQTLKIYQARQIGRFYEAEKTKQNFNDYNNAA